MKIQMLGICILLFFLVGCSRKSQEKDERQSMKPTGSMTREDEEDSEVHRILNGDDPESIAYEVVAVTDINYWERASCPFLHDCVTEPETAVSIAESLLKQFQNEGSFAGYSFQEIEYQDDPGIWVVHFREDPKPDELMPTFSIAIRKDNAQVDKMWVNE